MHVHYRGVLDVLIVGGGFTGSALACALADGRRKVRILEARKPSTPRHRFAGELIHPPGVAVLEQLGLRQPLLAAGGVSIEGFAVFDGPDAQPVKLPYQGLPGLAIDHEVLVDVMRGEAARRPHVQVQLGARVSGVERHGDRVTGVVTEDGQHHEAELVLVAEGRHSKMRAALGLACDSRLVSYTAAVRLPARHLPAPLSGHIFLGAPGPILAYAIGGGDARVCIDLPEAMHPAQAGEAIIRDWTPHVPQPFRDDLVAALRDKPPEMVANHAMRAREVTTAGAALVGDAGGCAHPLTAGGMTLCLNDVQLLVAELQRNTLPGALAAYQTARAPMARARAGLTDALYEIFRGDDEPLRGLRDGVLAYWTSERARNASVALLSGQETRSRSLAVEYARVVGRSILAGRGPRLAMLKTAARQARRIWGETRG